jgi:hypothetical protein
MKIKNKLKRLGVSLSAAVLVATSFLSVPIASATGSPTLGAPDQASCNSGSTTYIWDTLDHGDPVAPPTITHMSIKPTASSASEVIADPTNPTLGSIGASVCPNVAMGRRSGMFVYVKTNSGGDFDLTNGVTPDTESPITGDSEITITIDAGDMGDLAPYYSFSLVHGYVTNWVTSGLGTSNAALNITLKPVRTPYGNGDDFGFCTATPPNCNANKSDVDAISASLDMTFSTSGDEGTPSEVWDINGGGSSVRGAYFGMTGAMGAWAEAVGQGGQPRALKASLGGPHYLADGTTPNVGSLQAFIPDAVVENLFETTADQLSADTLSVTRTEGSTTDSANFTVTQVTGGVVVSMDNVTFSSPAYNIGLAGLDGSGGSEEDSDNSQTLTLPSGALANLETADGTTITSFTSTAESGLPQADPNFDYPLELQNFVVTVPSGSTQLVQLAYLTPLKPSQVTPRKYNAATHTYSTIPGATVTEEDFDGQHVLVVSYSITDGGNLDQDTVAGQITDPVGLGVAASSASTLAATGDNVALYQLAMLAMITSAGALLIAHRSRQQQSL